ncbi:hypothetical protein ACHAXT_008773 [Thalassiosira profunda]
MHKEHRQDTCGKASGEWTLEMDHSAMNEGILNSRVSATTAGVDKREEKMTKGVHSTALCAVGGFVVGTAALRILLDRSTAIPAAKQALQGPEQARTNTSVPSATSSIDEYEPDPETMYDWAYEEEDLILNETFVVPPSLSADAEEEEDAIPAGISVSRRMNLFDEPGFRLKLFWKEGYYWQESYAEKWWCMSCGLDGVCKKDDSMYLVNCKSKSHADARFTSTRRRKGLQYRVVGTDLCLQKIGRSRRIELRPCSKSQVLQQFKSKRGPDGGFDLRPARYTGRCLTNHHHPKAGELVYAESCRTAHRTKTGYWEKY